MWSINVNQIINVKLIILLLMLLLLLLWACLLLLITLYLVVSNECCSEARCVVVGVVTIMQHGCSSIVKKNQASNISMLLATVSNCSLILHLCILCQLFLILIFFYLNLNFSQISKSSLKSSQALSNFSNPL